MSAKFHIALAAALNLATYFFLNLSLIYCLGPGSDTDAFVASLTVPQFMLAVVGGSIGYVLVPMLSGKPLDELKRDSWCMVLAVGLFFAVLSAVLIATRMLWVPVLVPGFDDYWQDISSDLAAIQLFSLPISAVVSVEAASLLSQGKIALSEYRQFAANVVAIVAVAVFATDMNVFAAAWILVGRLILQCVLLTDVLGYPVKGVWNRAIPFFALAKAKPLLIGSAYYRTEPVIDRYLLSGISGGVLTLYYLADQIFGGASQLLNKVIASPMLAQLSVLSREKNVDAFKRFYNKAAGTACAFSFGFLLLFVGAAKMATSEVVGRYFGGLSAWSDISWIMLLLSGVLVGSAVGQVASAGFYAIGDTVTPAKMSIITYSVFVPAKICAFYKWGMPGLVVAASVYSLNNCILLIVLMNTKLIKHGISKL